MCTFVTYVMFLLGAVPSCPIVFSFWIHDSAVPFLVQTISFGFQFAETLIGHVSPGDSPLPGPLVPVVPGADPSFESIYSKFQRIIIPFVFISFILRSNSLLSSISYTNKSNNLECRMYPIAPNSLDKHLRYVKPLFPFATVQV